MDKTEAPIAALPEDDDAPGAAPRQRDPIPPSAERAAEGSQSGLPTVFFWALAAAVAFRVVTAVASRAPSEPGAGLVHWQPHAHAATAAVAAGKPVLYDFTAAWCAPCHLLDTEGWNDPQIASRVDLQFLPARVVDRQNEDGKNPPLIDELQRRYAVNAFPTLIVADSSGREIARMEGYGGKDRLVAFLEDASQKARSKAK